MADEKTIIMPEGQNNGWGNIPAVLALNGLGYNNGYNNGGFFGGNGSGFGAGILGGLLGGLIWNGIGFGNWGMGNWGNGGNGAAAASLGAQATAIGNTETILRAIDGTDSDVRLLATTLNSDVNTVKTNLATLQNGLTALTGQTGLSAQQIINAIQAGDASLAASLCQCCCEMKQLVTSQGYENQIRTLQQTETLGGAIADLKSTMIEQFCNQERREMQATITRQGDVITQLRNEADNARQTSAFAAMLAPIAQEVNDIKCKLPNTVPVTYPNITAVNNTPYMGGFLGGFNGFGYGPGWGNGSYWG
jgi:hypothetical protein